MSLALTVLADFPFILALAAALAAGFTAVMLRRAAPAVGTWAFQLGGLMWLVSMAALGWSFIWALNLRLSPGSPGVVTSFGTYGLIGQEDIDRQIRLPQAVVGLSIAACGAALGGWALRARSRLGLLAATFPSLVEQAPYRFIRRPGVGAWILVGLGVTVLADSLPVGVWFLCWLPAVLILAELGEGELRRRYPSLIDYFRRTPRFVPRKRPSKVDPTST